MGITGDLGVRSFRFVWNDMKALQKREAMLTVRTWYYTLFHPCKACLDGDKEEVEELDEGPNAQVHLHRGKELADYLIPGSSRLILAGLELLAPKGH